MPHVYEFRLDEKPVARMNLPYVLQDNDMAAIKLMLANRASAHVDRITHIFEWVNIVG